MSIVDFVENYIFQEFNEVQEIHWHSFQLTILVHICYQWNDAYLMDPNSVEDKYITKYQYYLFDDIKHDMLFVQHCFQLHWAHIRDHGIHLDEHIVWSNECAAQFKSKQTWYHVAK
jgi:hypothetical protein